MRVSQTCGVYIDKFPEEKAIDMMAEAGFEAIDFSFSREKYYNKDTDSEEFKQKLISLRKYAEEKGICFNQAHAPFPSSTNDEAETEEIFYNIVRSVRNASYLGIDCIAVHPKHHLRYKDEGSPEILFKENIDFYKRLEPYCKKYGVRAAVENMWQGYSFPGGWRVVDSVCSRSEEFLEYMEAIDSEWIVACLDIGHALIVHEDPCKIIRKLGNKYLKALHVHDVDGLDDTHTMPYHGGMGDWDKIAKALRDINYEGDFTMEVISFLSMLPEELYPTASKMLAETGKYIVNKIKEEN